MNSRGKCAKLYVVHRDMRSTTYLTAPPRPLPRIWVLDWRGLYRKLLRVGWMTKRIPAQVAIPTRGKGSCNIGAIVCPY